MGMKFICDDNLGKLAKYLRLLGFDTAYITPITNAELLARMLREDRLVITRDKRLAERIEPERMAIVDTDSPEQQLREVILKFSPPIDKERFFSRCLICNEICREISANEVKDRVFPYILKTKTQFRQCPRCSRIFWQGSHYHRMTAKLSQLLENQ
jgi:uncharacterized protein